jgi:hypothetical protein
VNGSNPTGNVGFTSNGTAIVGCGVVALSGAGNTKTAKCATTFAQKGSYNIVGSYGGDAGNAKSTSTTLAESIRRR